MKAVVAAALLLLAGCAGQVHDASQAATAAAVDTLDSDAEKKKLEDLLTAAVETARNTALSVDTAKQVTALVTSTGTQVRAEAVSTRDALLDEKLQAEVAQLREAAIGAGARAQVRQLLDEVLGPATQAQVDALREHLVGAPLQGDVDALSLHVAELSRAATQAALVSAGATVDAEASKYKGVAIYLGAAVGGLLIALCVTVWVIRSHHKLLAGMRRGP